MKLLKNIGYGCGTLAVLILVLFIILAVLIFVKKGKYDEITDPYFAEMIPILSEWDYKKFEEFWAPEVLERTKEKDLENLFGMYRRLGELLNYSDPAFVQVGTNTNIPYKSFIIYNVEAEYEAGKALMNWTLVNPGNNDLKVWGLKINSDVFIVPLENEEEDEDIEVPPI